MLKVFSHCSRLLVNRLPPPPPVMSAVLPAKSFIGIRSLVRLGRLRKIRRRPALTAFAHPVTHHDIGHQGFDQNYLQGSLGLPSASFVRNFSHQFQPAI